MKLLSTPNSLYNVRLRAVEFEKKPSRAVSSAPPPPEDPASYDDDLPPSYEPIPIWKRVLDLTFITITLPFWLPIMAALVVYLKFASPGPVFFRQKRVGYLGRNFMILKFRSMRVNAETRSHEGYLDQLITANRPMTKMDDLGDSRLIPGGRILRATGLDELPQLFNVIRGDMSLVGPRPCTLNEFAKYQPWQKARVNAPPGLTGFWQVSGKNKTTFSEMIAMDIIYADEMSVRNDVIIIFKTLPAIIDQILESQKRRRQAKQTADLSTTAA